MRLNKDPLSSNSQNNYFTSLERKFPEDPNPIAHLKPEQIQKSAKERIFREMVKGQIDYSQYGKFFLDQKFIGNLLIAANDELINNSALREALVFYDLHFPNNPKTITLLNKHTGLMQIYGVLVDKLTMVSMYDNIGYLTDISYILANFRNLI